LRRSFESALHSVIKTISDEGCFRCSPAEPH
jgi:hypothetical protein